MRAALPIAATGLLGLILLEIVKIVLAPVAAWVIMMLAIGLKLFLAVSATGLLLAIGIYATRRYLRHRAEVNG